MNYPMVVVESIKNGGVGVMPTDTIFGIVASALDQNAIQRIYKIKGRNPDKPFVVLIACEDHLRQLHIETNIGFAELQKIWVDPVSIIMNCSSDELLYLHRGTRSLAIRLPNNRALTALLENVGPIVATSANASGEPTATSINEIKNELPGLDFYLDGPTGATPSKLARLQDNGGIEWIARS